ncbi:hypothetical protein PC128_g5739 [Phytophthora cactorum]|nr:hypothetical protein PC128_g5739 [Phytophthora cactorum]KAG4063780.1 hypothetical protein PC123_g1433 [Phytophthora cactorum]
MKKEPARIVWTGERLERSAASLRSKRRVQTQRGPSKIPLPKTPETKKCEGFRATKGTPYFEDSHMQTPVKAELGGGDNEDDEPNYRGDPDGSVRDYIRHLSFDKAEEDTTQYLGVHSHASLDKIAEFDGKCYALTRRSNGSRGSSMK